jgi:hypothetical protein
MQDFRLDEVVNRTLRGGVDRLLATRSVWQSVRKAGADDAQCGRASATEFPACTRSPAAL